MGEEYVEYYIQKIDFCTRTLKLIDITKNNMITTLVNSAKYTQRNMRDNIQEITEQMLTEILKEIKNFWNIHESYTIIRGGKPAASLVPVETSPVRKTLRELKTVLSNLPRLGNDAEGFL